MHLQRSRKAPNTLKFPKQPSLPTWPCSKAKDHSFALYTYASARIYAQLNLHSAIFISRANMCVLILSSHGKKKNESKFCLLLQQQEGLFKLYICNIAIYKWTPMNFTSWSFGELHYQLSTPSIFLALWQDFLLQIVCQSSQNKDRLGMPLGKVLIMARHLTPVSLSLCNTPLLGC